MAETMQEGSSSERETQVYEVSYLLLPIIAEENVAAEVGNIRSALDALGAVVITDELPKMIPLAYAMEKNISNKKEHFDQGYFGWIKYELEPEKAEELKTELDRNASILRFLTLKTVRENTLAAKRPISTYKKRTKKDDATEGEANKEEIDQKIDEMVTEEAAAPEKE